MATERDEVQPGAGQPGAMSQRGAGQPGAVSQRGAGQPRAMSQPGAGQPRGALRVFLGCAPGVGKTYEMLLQARGLLAEGVDVVIAVVETHGRSATAAVAEGIEQVAPREVTYRGTTLQDVDVAAVIARAPEVVLVDELAHSNPPGSAHPKRWQDIEDLLAAGIDVLSTVNIQHLESLNDVVEQITGVAQHETVPDAVVRAAAEIELVDISPEALRQRLAAGKVYGTDRAHGALANYFRQGNLTALRELALLWLADRVEESLADYRAQHGITATWETRERVVVAVTGGPESATLIRRASRIASRSSAELVVVHVVRGDGLLSAGGTSIAELRDVAAAVGAQVHTVVGADIPATLLEFARGVNATQLVLGTSRRSRLARLLDEGVGAAVVRQSGKIDVHMVTHEQAQGRNPFDIRQSRARRPLTWMLAVLIPAACAGVLYLLDTWLQFASESALFFVAVLAVSLLGGVGPAALSAVVSGVLLNYLFTDPRYSLTIAEPNNLVTIIVLLVVAIAIAVLVDSAASRRREAVAAGREAELLASFSDAVLSGDGLTELLDRVRVIYDQQAVALVTTGDRRHDLRGGVGDDPPLTAAAADTSVTDRGGDYQLLLRGPKLQGRDRRVLSAVANQAADLVQRQHLAADAAAAQALAETDRLRQALLSAVSHDLRTPLAAVKAAASSLRSADVDFSPEDTAELLATIEESTDQLTRLVGNLLDSSRLAAGVVRPQSRLVYLGEIVGRAMIPAHLQGAAERVRIDVADTWVYADAGLLERVLANLVENALKHSRYEPAERSVVEVSATTVADPAADGVDERCRIRVIDHGPGVPAEQREAMFAPFQRLGDRDTTSGVGLGLSVAAGFTAAMGGTLTPQETPGGGLTMVVDLPTRERTTG